MFDKVWEYDLRNGTIAFGGRELEDVSRLSESELIEKYKKVYGPDSPIDRKSIWRLYHEFCLIDDVQYAIQAGLKFYELGAEPGPYYLFEVHRRAEKR
ncbi:hypothetical protein HYR99_17555 [Candidatus Poribacteria bacterium]|nr:hypothetical protein [Candidatus Poribacteria bacterium]